MTSDNEYESETDTDNNENDENDENNGNDMVAIPSTSSGYNKKLRTRQRINYNVNKQFHDIDKALAEIDKEDKRKVTKSIQKKKRTPKRKEKKRNFGRKRKTKHRR